MERKQLSALESLYLRALCCLDLYRLRGRDESLSVGQFAAVSGLDWSELDELEQWLEKRGIEL